MTNRTSNTRHPLLKLLPYLGNYKKQLATIFVFILFLLAVQLVRPLLLKYAIDHYLSSKNITGLNLIVLIFVLMLVLEFAFAYVQAYLTERVSQQVMARLRLDVFQKIESQSLAFFDRNKVGALISRITSDIDKLEDMFTTGLIDTLIKLIMIVIVTVIIFCLNVKLAWLTLALLPFTLAVFYVFSGFVIQKYRELRVLAARLSGYLQENIGNMKIIQVFNQETRHQREFETINGQVSTVNNQIIFSFALLFPLIEISASLTTAAVLWYGGHRVFAGTLTLGTIIAFLEYIQKLFNPFKDLSERYNVIQSATASAERIFELLESNDYLICEGEIQLPERPGLIEIKNLWFAYLEKEWVIKDVSLTIHPGEKIAIIGATGSGKSTLLKLLLRLYDPQQGRIEISGLPLSELNNASLKSRFGYITQDPYLFSDTIANNIRLFDLNISDLQIRDAAAFTGSEGFITRNEAGYDFFLQEKGANLSVGEKQLLALARLAAINPPVFLLDEATAHIDVITEALIEDNLRRIMATRTSIVVAHRLSTIKAADRIIVMDQGRIVETGNHDALLQKKGTYYRLYKYQYEQNR